jgi:leader peptidase (prepilin peptidase)/N-methyltransferase
MTSDSLPLWLVWTGYSLLSLVVGSFISLLTARLPEWITADSKEFWQSVAWRPSECAHCHHTLGVWQLIPLVSWLWQGGRSHCCQQRISIRYPLIELFSLLLTLAFLQITPINLTQNTLSVHLSALAQLTFLWGLLSISITDTEHRLIPDRISLSLIWLGLLFNSLTGELTSLTDAVWGASMGYVSLWLLFQLHHALTGRIGMGYGDFKLTAAIGAWLGWQSLIPLFILAGSGAILFTLAAMLFGKHRFSQHFAFGPWLSLAAVILLFNTLK